mmetsp:Transcript_4006/g.9135  ORF Transcript_4006/g.9135 Transcript_4006/m.9135 type:complete len:165 (+) Transcript_4006:253-747(+)
MTTVAAVRLCLLAVLAALLVTSPALCQNRAFVAGGGSSNADVSYRSTATGGSTEAYAFHGIPHWTGTSRSKSTAASSNAQGVTLSGSVAVALDPHEEEGSAAASFAGAGAYGPGFATAKGKGQEAGGNDPHVTAHATWSGLAAAGACTLFEGLHGCDLHVDVGK